MADYDQELKGFNSFAINHNGKIVLVPLPNWAFDGNHTAFLRVWGGKVHVDLYSYTQSYEFDLESSGGIASRIADSTTDWSSVASKRRSLMATVLDGSTATLAFSDYPNGCIYRRFESTRSERA